MVVDPPAPVPTPAQRAVNGEAGVFNYQPLTVEAEPLPTTGTVRVASMTRRTRTGTTPIEDFDTPLSAVTPIEVFPAAVSGEIKDGAQLTLEKVTVDEAKDGGLLAWLAGGLMYLDGYDMSLGGTNDAPLYTGSLDMMIAMGEEYIGQTVYVLYYEDGMPKALIPCEVDENGLLQYETDEIGEFMILRDWDTLGLPDWLDMDSVAAGYLDSTLVSKVALTAQELAYMDELFRILQSTEETLKLLNVNTGTRLDIAMPQDEGPMPQPIIDVLEEGAEALDGLVLPEGATFLGAGMLSILRGDGEMALVGTSLLSFVLIEPIPAGETVTVWAQGADGRIALDVDALGAYVITR